ncbi:hypothetical protein E2562_000020 [Oryza meyeriana var. granulata]|uniref:Uncharacterized protein n=1 Tax=Oryza meyeriana var. granulata TaxID=110450 RepID=A0A6G1DAA3_9ORYZ|nr:hypothetical protein E2562_000020 [Oryza meyeriana var. granulata]
MTASDDAAACGAVAEGGLTMAGDSTAGQQHLASFRAMLGDAATVQHAACDGTVEGGCGAACGGAAGRRRHQASTTQLGS